MKQTFPTDARPSPPDWLSPAQAREWRDIVNSLAADYFRPSDAPMLAAYCCAAAAHKAAAAELEIGGLILDGQKGYRFPNPAAAIMSQQSSTMSQLATKLRLCPSARIAKGEKAPKGQIGQRPWIEPKVA
jgi:P27 family predicted phage terminase small subunit